MAVPAESQHQQPPPDANPGAIRAALLPAEAADFDREFRHAMAEATETLDLTGVLELLRRWQRVAWSSQDERAHTRMLEHANQLATGQHVATEPWRETKARLDIQLYNVETDTEALEQIEALPANGLAAYAELMVMLEVAPWSGDAYNRQRPDANMRTHSENMATDW